MKFDSVKLDNGLNVYLLLDKNKHVSLANLIVNFGGIDNKYIYNDKIKKIKSGCAHFLEHLALESSEYGDLMSIFGSKGVRSNGLTTIERTEFYIDCVDDFYLNLSLLIKGIHSPLFNKDRIDEIRKPILEEKRKSLDNKYANLYNACLSTYLNNNKFDSILGRMKDIESINISDLNDVFKAFYRPSNEILIISGNFDKEKVINTINDAYNSLEFNTSLFERFKYKNNDKVNIKKKVIKDNVNIGKGVITYKINISKFSNYDKLVLDTYIYSFLRMNFGVTSKLNKDLIKNRTIVGNIMYLTSVVDDYYIIRIEANTDKFKEFEKNIIDFIIYKKYVFDEELFELYKKSYIIDVIVRNDNIYNMLEPFIQNIVFFNYEGIDDVKDIENMTFKCFKENINSLDFTIYSITELRSK